MSDQNMDHSDLLEAQGKFEPDDESSDAWRESYNRYLDDLYEKDRLQRKELKKGRF